MSRRAQIVVLAVLGVLVAVGIALAAGKLVRQPIGIASEPVTAGRRLAPAPATSARPPKRAAHGARPRARPPARRRGTGTATTPATAAPAPPAATPSATTPTPAQGGSGADGDDGGERGSGDD